MKQISYSSFNEVLSEKYVIIEISDNAPDINRKIFPELFLKNKKINNSGLSFISQEIHDAQGHIIITDSHLGNDVNPVTSIKYYSKFQNSFY